jgi:hypothetical protein
MLDAGTGQDRLFGVLDHFAPNYNMGLSIARDGSSVLYDGVVSNGANLMLIENFR